MKDGIILEANIQGAISMVSPKGCPYNIVILKLDNATTIALSEAIAKTHLSNVYYTQLALIEKLYSDGYLPKDKYEALIEKYDVPLDVEVKEAEPKLETQKETILEEKRIIQRETTRQTHAQPQNQNLGLTMIDEWLKDYYENWNTLSLPKKLKAVKLAEGYPDKTIAQKLLTLYTQES